MKKLLVGFGVLLALSGCGDKNKGATETPKAVETNKQQESMDKNPDQQPAGIKEHNDAVLAKHMKCRQERGSDCFKILDEMQK